MEKRAYYSLRLLSCICMLTVINAQTQLNTRFLVLSIDCGAASPYNDSTLGIEWQTDQMYISTGTSVQMKEDVDLPKHLYSYTSFTSGRSKDCYTLPLKTETTYLLRVRLFPGSGGTSSVALPVDFNVTVNSNHWFNYSADNDRNEVIQESIFYSFQKNEVDVCLLKGTRGAPFINSIELRILPTTSYAETKSQQDHPSFLVLGDRLNMGTKPTDNKPFRFPDDDFDRIWWPALPPKYPPYSRADGSSILSNLTFFNYYPDYEYDLTSENWAPNRTLIDAWIGEDLSFNITRERVDTERIVATFYYMEIRPDVDVSLLNSTNPEEIFNSVGPGQTDYDYQVIKSRLDTSFQKVITINGNLDAMITVNVSYLFGPFLKIILNGFEYYYLYEVDLRSTYSPDRKILKSIQASFGLEDWKGDPCYPVAWDWLTCDPGSRIQTLNLTGMKLSGPIPEDISSLPELTEIYLDNNNLSGHIPLSLASLTKLKILKLDNNQLTGDIPRELLEMPGLILTVRGNPGLVFARVNGSVSPVPSPAESSAPIRSSSYPDVLYRMMLFEFLLWICVLGSFL